MISVCKHCEDSFHITVHIIISFLKLVECPAGTWGRNCKNTCGSCLGQTCHHDNGNCENGCLSGYEGEHCAGRAYILYDTLFNVQTIALL